MSMQTITTIIPTFRRPKLLERAILSALRQTYPHIQVCVYDNASMDETAELVAKIGEQDSRLKYYCHRENIGSGANFQFGLQNTETPFFSFLSDDDYLLPNFYERAMEDFQRFPDIALFAGSCISLKDDKIVDV